MERICIREPLNANDRYAVALKKDGAVVGHLPQKISRICALFIRRGGTLQVQEDTELYSTELLSYIYNRCIVFRVSIFRGCVTPTKYSYCQIFPKLR